MNNLLASCYVEYLKTRRTKVLWLTISALCLAPVFGAVFVIILRNPSLAAGNELLKTKAALTGFSADWSSFFNLIAQAVGVGGVIVFGFVTSWVFGREYSDHTIKEIFTLPVSRTTIVIAKTIACTIWCFVITLTVTIVGLVIGALLNLPNWEFSTLLSAIKHILITAILAILLCPPVSFIASAGRGYLASLGFVVFSVVLAQIIGALGFGAYVPWAIPALFSGLGSEAGGSLNFMSYTILVVTSIAGLFGTVYWWKYVDQAK